MQVNAWLRTLALAAALASLPNFATAAPLTFFETVFNTDYAYFGTGGMRGTGTGSLTVTGITSDVTRAIIHWHGPTNSLDPTAGAAVTFNGTDIVGTNIGFGNDNCWGFQNSQAYYADVTDLITGNGTYSLTNFLGPNADVNGVSLQVFYSDGDSTNNRDIVMFHGNDSNIASAFDPSNWNAVLSGINYSGGSASVVLGVSDGQTFADEAVFFESSQTGVHTLFPAGANDGILDGASVPNTGGNSTLWDLHCADISAWLGTGINNSRVFTTSTAGDCLGLISVTFNLPAGAAPEQPPNGVPEPGTLLLMGTALAFAVRRRAMRAFFD